MRQHREPRRWQNHQGSQQYFRLAYCGPIPRSTYVRSTRYTCTFHAICRSGIAFTISQHPTTTNYIGVLLAPALPL